jgi:hypothetical protein
VLAQTGPLVLDRWGKNALRQIDLSGSTDPKRDGLEMMTPG